MVLALVLPVAAYPVAHAQPKTPGATSAQPSGSVSGGASSSASAPAVPNAAASPGASVTVPPSPLAVTVDMNVKPADSALNGATYSVRLRDLEQRVDELKDQIRRSHTRLALLSDTILGGGAAGSRSDVEFDNEMSSAFLLTRALFVIDNQVQYNRQDDSGALAEQKQIPIYSGSVPPGDHTIVVSLTFQGNGYGIFSYLRGYKFEVKSSHSFTAIEGKTLTISATAFEKGGVTTPLEQRPTIEWHETLHPFTGGPPTSGSVPASSPSPAGAAGMTSPGGATATGAVSIGGGKK